MKLFEELPQQHEQCERHYAEKGNGYELLKYVAIDSFHGNKSESEKIL